MSKQVELAFRRCRAGPLAGAGAVHAANGGKAGPAVVGQPGDVGADARRTLLHPSMSGIGFRVLRHGHERVVQKGLHVVVQRKRKPVPTVESCGVGQAALAARASLQFQGRSSLSLVAMWPAASWPMAWAR